MKKNIIAALLTGVVLLPAATSCDDFLDKEPSKSTQKTIQDVSQLDALLASYNSLYSESNSTFIASDDYGLTTEVEDARTSSSYANDLDVLTWSDENNSTSRNLWDGEFSKIFRANLVLANVDAVTGDEAEKANIKAEAHLLRAYSMFQLAVCHCLYPSAENAAELGLPLKATTSFEESVARRPLGETFAFIENDITEALKITKHLVEGDRLQNWRGTTASANAFAARFYLYMGDTDKAAQYAGAVLSEYDVLKDFNDPTEMYFNVNQDTYTINAGTPEEEVVKVTYPYMKAQLYGSAPFIDFLGWKEMLFARSMAYASWWFIPSKSMLDNYKVDIKDGNADYDLRYRYFVVEDYGLRYCKKTTEGRQYGYCQFYYDNIISGPTVAEMYLIKAEAAARKGDAGSAMASLNRLRKNRIATEAYADLTASGKDDAILKVVQERRREMPLTMRWYDIKRYAYTPETVDDVVITRSFYPYTTAAVQSGETPVSHTLELKSRHYALPIPDIDIRRSEGVVEQNKY